MFTLVLFVVVPAFSACWIRWSTWWLNTKESTTLTTSSPAPTSISVKARCTVRGSGGLGRQAVRRPACG